MVDDRSPNPPKSTFEAEDRVYDWLSRQSWMTDAELTDAYNYWHDVAVAEGILPP